MENLIGPLKLRLLLALIALFLITPSAVPSALVLYVKKASREISSHQPEAALQDLELAIEFAPTLRSLYLLAAEAAYEAHRYADALNFLQKASEVPGPEKPLACWQGHVLSEIGDQNGAIQAWKRSLLDCPQRDILLDMLGQAYLKRGQDAQAIAMLQRLVSLDSEDVHHRLELALLLAATRPREAMQHLQILEGNTIEANPLVQDLIETIDASRTVDSEAYLLGAVGQVFTRRQEYDLAQKAYQNALAIQPDYHQVLPYLGFVRMKAHGTGLEMLEKAAQTAPESVISHTFLALAYLDLERTQDAITQLKIAAQLDPQNPVISAQLGAAYAADGDLEAAVIAYIRATELAPSQAGFWLLLAQFSIANHYELQALGLPAARNALSIEPQNGAALDALGYAYLLQGDLILAERFLLSAAEANPIRALTQYHIGLLRIAQQDRSRARAAMAMVLELNPEGGLSQLAQRSLATMGP